MRTNGFAVGRVRPYPYMHIQIYGGPLFKNSPIAIELGEQYSDLGE